MFLEGNLTEPNTVNHMIENGLTKFGNIDAAVHCAYPISEQWGTRFEDLKSAGLEKELFNPKKLQIFSEDYQLFDEINPYHKGKKQRNY